MIGFDLDGTLLDTPVGINYDDELQCAQVGPFPTVKTRCTRIAEQYQVCVITGRGEATRAITQSQVDYLFGVHVPLFMQQRFQGWDVLRDFKAATLVEKGCTLYVGDMRLDSDAARIAECNFLHAEEWRQRPGHGIPEVLA